MSDVNFEFKFYGREARENMNSNMRTRVAAAAYHLHGELIEKVSGVGSGEVYRVPGTDTKYQASAPGEAPAVQLANLKKKIAVEIDNRSREIQAYVGVRGVPYAKRLEFGFVGTDSKGRVYNQAPRPFFNVTYEEQREYIKRLLRG